MPPATLQNPCNDFCVCVRDQPFKYSTGPLQPKPGVGGETPPPCRSTATASAEMLENATSKRELEKSYSFGFGEMLRRRNSTGITTDVKRKWEEGMSEGQIMRSKKIRMYTLIKVVLIPSGLSCCAVSHWRANDQQSISAWVRAHSQLCKSSHHMHLIYRIKFITSARGCLLL